MLLRVKGIPQEDHQVDGVVLDLCAQLLIPPQMAGQKFVHVQIGHFLNEAPRSPRGVECVSAQNTPVGDAEILHQLFL